MVVLCEKLSWYTEAAPVHWDSFAHMLQFAYKQLFELRRKTEGMADLGPTATACFACAFV